MTSLSTPGTRRRRLKTGTSETHMSGSVNSLDTFREKEKALLEKALREKEQKDQEKLIQAEKSETGRVSAPTTSQ